MSAKAPLQTLQQKIAELERENRQLNEELQQGERMRHLWQDSLEELKSAKRWLKRRNAELASLCQVASALSGTVGPRQLFYRIMDTMAALFPPTPDPTMGIFLIEGEQMRLAAYRGADEAFANLHENLRLGECLCGISAASGEVVLSEDGSSDPRHTLSCSGLDPHGHVVLPLKAKGRVVGVFYYYLPIGFEFQEGQLDTLVAIGNQLGLAIENAILCEEISNLSMRDTLTGLGNRRYLEFAMERDLHNARRYHRRISVVMLDIDHFAYNNSNDNSEGDRLLASVAESVRETLRAGDLPVRYGEDEFLVLLPDTGISDARIVAERIRRRVEEATPVTVSLGVAAIGKGVPDGDALICAADKAMREAKRAGRNRIRVAKG